VEAAVKDRPGWPGFTAATGGVTGKIELQYGNNGSGCGDFADDLSS